MSQLKLLLALALVTACTSSDTPPTGGGTTGTDDAFFLPTGATPDNTSAPTVRVDAQGNTHAVYPSYAGGGAYYAFCGAGCDGANKTKVVRFETPDGTVTNAMLALTSDGHPRVLLSAFQNVYFASCDANCTDQAGWTVASILDKGSDYDVTGDAFALDAQDRPRFLMHTHVAYLGIGQKDPVTSWHACDDHCTSASAWTSTSLDTKAIWQGSTLLYDSHNVAKLATVMGYDDQIVYFECAGNCSAGESWHGNALGTAYETEADIVSIHPRAQMALTSTGTPRILALARAEDSTRALGYLSCDTNCTMGPWSAVLVSTNAKLNEGYALALDATNKPQVVYTLDYNIAFASCGATCPDGSAANATFTMSMAQASTALPADEIFLNYNCSVGAWLFHGPSIALTPDGHARIGYQARDASAAGATSDPTHGTCVAGTDMTWSRLALR